MRLKLCCAAIAVVLVLAGCGDDSSSGTSDDQAATSTPQQTTTVVRHTNRLPKPRSPGPHPGARIDQLIVRDVRVGSGPELHAGDDGVFDFIGTNYVTGRPLDASWGRRRPFETTIEGSVVIGGWWQGIPGMRVGGRRQIIVPPGLGFTQSLVPGLRGATTYFDIVLLQVNPARPRGLQEPRDAPTPG
jgi:FKBP-type peptidyl-prolyl cis-trans isomerase